MSKNIIGKKVRPLSKDEINAIRTLKRLAKRWPESLWLFSAGPALNVMQCDENNKQAALHHGGMDPEYVVDKIDIPHGGGDW